MGAVYARLRLQSALRDVLVPVEIDAMVDSGAINLCIPDIVRRELQLKPYETRLVLPGAIPMQDLDVVIDPRNAHLIAPPERPNFALSKVK